MFYVSLTIWVEIQVISSWERWVNDGVHSRDKILADFQTLVEPLANEKGATTFGSVKLFMINIMIIITMITCNQLIKVGTCWGSYPVVISHHNHSTHIVYDVHNIKQSINSKVGTCWGSYPVVRFSALPQFKAGVSAHPRFFCLFRNPPMIREGWRLQNGWIFGKVPKGGGCHFQSKNLYCRFWTFK